jgi:predicted anti-sigma-YlaC factor YlaD
VTDCTNAELRDLLPDVLHGSLTAADRARVEAHVAACSDCRAELALLQRVFASYPAPHVNASAVVGSIASYGVRHSQRTRLPQYMRIAAAIAIVSLGGASYSLLTRGAWFRDGAVAESTLALLGDSADRALAGTETTVSYTGDISSLDEQAMADLLSRIETLELEISETPRPLVRSPRVEGGIE